jgi:hypothetical protein
MRRSFRFLRMAGMLQVPYMKRKACFFLLLPVLAHGTFLHGVESSLPDKAGTFLPPAGWIRTVSEMLVLRGPGRDANEAPRLAVTLADGDTASISASLRDGWTRVADGCELLDDDDEPLGGRVWRRIRVRFAAGPLAFGQTAWVGSVSGRTVVVVLSAPDERIGQHLATAAAAVASISAPR